MIPPISFLYVPGDDAERLARAATRGADALVADLEDAVAPADKPRALHNVREWLAAPHAGASRWVRVNPGPSLPDELRALSATAHALDGVFVPKVESPETIVAVRSILGPGVRIAPLIESATGLRRIDEIAAVEGVYQLHLGEMDLAADLGLSPDADGTQLAFARWTVVVASRHAGLVAPAAPVSAEIADVAEFRRTTRALFAAGFVGRDCIHPAQVAAVHAESVPDAEEVRWAHDVLSRAEDGPGAFRDAEGRMIDEAVLRRARRIAQTANR